MGRIRSAVAEPFSLSDSILIRLYPVLEGISEDFSRFDNSTLIVNQLQALDDSEQPLLSNDDPRFRNLVDAVKLNGDLMLYRAMQADVMPRVLMLHMGLLSILRSKYRYDTQELVADIKATAKALSDAYMRENQESNKDSWDEILAIIDKEK
jgi:hypothetical protein